MLDWDNAPEASGQYWWDRASNLGFIPVLSQVQLPLYGVEHGFQGVPLLEADNRAVGEVRFFDDWAAHTSRDSYWSAIDGESRARTIRAPVFLMAGWYDPFLPTQLRDFETIRREADPRIAAESRLVIGPWTHADAVRFPDGSSAGNYRAASIAPSISWFDHHLLGWPREDSLKAPVRIFVMGENVWREEQQWPLARARSTPLYLRSGGRANSTRGDGELSPERAATADTPDSFVYDPLQPVPSRGGTMLGPRSGIALQNDVESRPDVLVYSTRPLESDIEVTGPVSAILYVTTTAPSTDFCVKLVDVYPDGRAYNVSDGILRRNYMPNTPLEPVEITVELWPTSMLFRRGHRIRVEVSSSNFPRYDRNPNTGRHIPSETIAVRATQALNHGPTTASRIVLPIVPR